MKTKFISALILCLIFCTNCKKENNPLPTLDYPASFIVSKGTFADRINLSWNIPPKSKLFEVYRADSITDDYQLIAKTENSFYADSSRHVATKKYYYKVRVYNSENEFSDYTNYDYGFVAKFAAPSISQSSPFGTGDNFIKLEWAAVNGSNKYLIFRSSNNIDFSLLDSTTSTTYTDVKNLIPGNTFYYKAKAFNKLIGYSGFSQVDSGYIYENYSLAESFGSFTLASYIDFDSKGNVYVVDATAGKVQLFDQNYTYLKDFISSPGTTFRGIRFTPDDKVILAESNKGMIGFFDSNGQLLKEKTVSNTTVLRQITTDLSNNIYVTDLGNTQIIKLNNNGDILKSWKSTSVDVDFGAYSVFCSDNSLMFSSLNGSQLDFCSLEGAFLKSWPGINAACIAMDKSSNFYFACFNRIVKTDKTGKILAVIGMDVLQEAQTVNVAANGDVLVTDGKKPSRVFIYRK